MIRTKVQKKLAAALLLASLPGFSVFASAAAYAGSGNSDLGGNWAVAAVDFASSLRLPPSHRDILFNIVTQCLAKPASAAGLSRYCAQCPAPLPELFARCQPGLAAAQNPAMICRKTVSVWAKNSRFAAIRDIKMCGCLGSGFIHGLAIPLAKVTGLEDVSRLPPAIWRFAWSAAAGKIKDEDSIALAVNPPKWRSQDQLHIHLVRLAPGARQRIANFGPITVKGLGGIWAAEERLAKNKGLAQGSYGLILARDLTARGFEIAVIPASAGSPEYLFTQALCPK